MREYDVFKQWSIEGGKNISLSKISSALNEIPKDNEIITIFCPQGNRDGMVTFTLERQGYNVKTLEERLKDGCQPFWGGHYSQNDDGKKNF